MTLWVLNYYKSILLDFFYFLRQNKNERKAFPWSDCGSFALSESLGFGGAGDLQ
jgi:hypothetical protein